LEPVREKHPARGMAGRGKKEIIASFSENTT
jgi:hypothetical protein